MVDYLYSLDKKIFLLINQGFGHPWLDVFMVSLTNLHNSNWALFGLLPLVLALWIWKERFRAVKIFLALGVLAAVCDLFSYRLVKQFIQRPRPNHLIELEATVKVPHSPTSYSFPSNHAVTSFALATLLSFFYPKLSILFFTVASLIGLSRVYVGVHFLSDVVGGMIIGLCFGFLFIRLIKWANKKATWLKLT